MTKGAIAAGHDLTAGAGAEMLKAGGNAFDAAVAAVFASVVTESTLTSLGGGGFLMAHSSGGGTDLYDFFTNTPGRGGKCAATAENFFPVGIHFTAALQDFYIGRGSAAVPGMLAGLGLVFKERCTLPLKELLAPAIDYAKNGVVLNADHAHFIEVLSPMLLYSEEGRGIYAPGGRALIKGETLCNKHLATTLEALSKKGFERFCRADFAPNLLESFGEPLGLITEEDLNEYKAVRRRPLHFNFRGSDIYTNPPPSSGGSLVAFALKLIEGCDLRAIGAASADGLELLYEMMRATDRARAGHFDGSAHNAGEAEAFLTEETVRLFRGDIEKIMAVAGAGPGHGHGSTTHISVMDRLGNAAAVTTSSGIGSGFFLPGMGVLVNSMLGEEDVNPGGFHRLEPGIRLSSMMAPTIVMKDVLPSIVLGTGGSNRIRNTLVQVIINIIVHGMDAFTAVNRPRLHFDGTALQVEAGVSEAALEELRKRGVNVNAWDRKHMYFGGAHIVVSGGDDFTGAGDDRRGGVFLRVG
ncbi:Gamma-glutamyltranspeptidase @ Glutathione hydrolase [hydrothermal vent metagenome]|uniref:Gamma-glutamyltranspeptidase @ Glutathione hydrolase n=1 Tax=hydrothermal vent metagenome TaxID=652676 RepID=A0A3B0V2W9_9ZZZZ